MLLQHAAEGKITTPQFVFVASRCEAHSASLTESLAGRSCWHSVHSMVSLALSCGPIPGSSLDVKSAVIELTPLLKATIGMTLLP